MHPSVSFSLYSPPNPKYPPRVSDGHTETRSRLTHDTARAASTQTQDRRDNRPTTARRGPNAVQNMPTLMRAASAFVTATPSAAVVTVHFVGACGSDRGPGRCMRCVANAERVPAPRRMQIYKLRDEAPLHPNGTLSPPFHSHHATAAATLLICAQAFKRRCIAALCSELKSRPHTHHISERKKATHALHPPVDGALVDVQYHGMVIGHGRRVHPQHDRDPWAAQGLIRLRDGSLNAHLH